MRLSSIKVCACYELHDTHNITHLNQKYKMRKFIEEKNSMNLNEHGKLDALIVLIVCVLLFSMKIKRNIMSSSLKMM